MSLRRTKTSWDGSYVLRISAISLKQRTQHMEQEEVYDKDHMSHITRKPVFWGLRPVKTQIKLLSYKMLLESWNFENLQFIYAANNKGADQTAQMRRLICTFVVRIRQKQVFSWCGSCLLLNGYVRVKATNGIMLSRSCFSWYGSTY